MVDGTLFFSTPYNRVIALDAETGKERWAWDAQGRSHAPGRDRHVAGRLHMGRCRGSRRRRVSPSHLRRDRRRAARRPRCGDRRAVRRLRTGRRGRPHGGNRRPRRLPLLSGDIAARHRAGARRRRLLDRRQPRREPRARRRARLRRAERRAAMELGSDSDARVGSGARDVGRRQLASHGGGERVVRDVGRPGTRARLPAHEQSEPRLLRRRAPRRKRVRQFGGGAAGRDGRRRLVLPGRASRPVGLRRARAARARERHSGREGRFPRLSSRPRWGTSSSCIARPVRRSSPSRSAPFRRAACPARKRHRRSRFRSGRDRSCPARLTADDAWGLTPAERDACRARITRLRSEGIFTPPSLEGTVIFPGYAGGTNWGSVSHDPVRGLLIAATNRLAFVVTLVPRDRYQAERSRGSASGPPVRPAARHALRDVS